MEICGFKNDMSCILVLVTKLGLIFLLLSFCVYIANASPEPAIYDDFSDGKLQNRTGTDPWGQSLPEWVVESGSWSADRGYLTPNNDTDSRIYINTSQWGFYGTYELSWYVPEGTPYFIITDNIANYQSKNSFVFNWFAKSEGDSHLFGSCTQEPIATDIYDNIYASRQLFKHQFNCASSHHHNAYTSKWYTTIIVLIPKDNGTVIEFYESNSLNVSKTPYMMPFSKVWDKHTINNPNLALKANKKGIRFDNIKFYPNWYYDGYGTKYNSSINAIEIRGKGHTLKNLNTSFSNSSVFEYYSSNRTAYCSADIRLDGGSSLTIVNETLIMDCSKSIYLKNLFESDPQSANSKIYIYNSTLKSKNCYWNFESWDGAEIRIINSTLKNLDEFTWRASNLSIKNSLLEFNKMNAPYHKSEMDRYRYGVSIENSTLNQYDGGYFGLYARDDDPNFYHLAYDDINFKDSIFKNCDFVNIDKININYGGKWSLQNVANITKFFNSAYSGGYVLVKYYLDVLVLDKDGEPVKNASVTVTEINNSINVTDYNGNNLKTVFTKNNGHTPLPYQDKNNTFVLVDFKVRNPNPYEINYENFSYNVIVEKGDHINHTIIDPDANWFRSRPNSYQNTIKIKLPIDLDVPKLSSSDSDGTLKDNFIDEPIYIKGHNFPENKEVDIYVVDNLPSEYNNIDINTLNMKYTETVSTNDTGYLEFIWSNPVEGEYDIIADVDQDGVYNRSIDAVDDFSSEPGVTAVITTTTVTTNDLDFGTLEVTDSFYYITTYSEIKSTPREAEAENITPFATVEGDGPVKVFLGSNKTLPQNTTIYLTHDKILNESNTILTIKGNINNSAEIIGDTTTGAENIYLFLRTGDIRGEVDFNVDLEVLAVHQ